MKKLVLPIIVSLVIGFGIGYFVQSKISSNQVTAITHQASTSDANTAKGFTFSYSPSDVVIGSTDAKTGIKAFNALNLADIASGGGLFVDDPIQHKQPLQGFLILKSSLQDIFTKNPNWTGLRVYFAKHPDHPDPSDRVFTVFFTAATSSNTLGIPNNDTDTDPIYDHVYPCPTVCGSLTKP